MRSSIVELEEYQYKKPFFDSFEGLSDIGKLRGMDPDDRSKQYRIFRETYKDELEKFESALTNNISSFVHLADLWAMTKDKDKKMACKDILDGYCEQEPRYFAWKQKNDKWGWSCLTVAYANKKIDE